MIDAKGSLTGFINSKQTLNGELNKAVEYVDPITQEKEVTATKETQIVEPDKGYTGLSKVTINGYVPNVDKKTITANGTYKASEDNLDGYSEVEVETSGVDINDYFIETPQSSRVYENIKQVPQLDTSKMTSLSNFFSGMRRLENVPILNTSKVTNMSYMFYNCSYALKEVPLMDTSNATDLSFMFYSCSSLTFVPQFDTSKVTNMSNMFCDCRELTSIPTLNTKSLINAYNMFSNCRKLITIPQLNFQNVTNVSYTFNQCAELTDFGGLLNIGQSFLTTAAEEFGNYRLQFNSCSKLTHESLMNIINGLYDIKAKGCKAQQLLLGSINKAKLTEEEIEIATNKGWNVS